MEVSGLQRGDTPNNGMQRTPQSGAADAERWATRAASRQIPSPIRSPASRWPLGGTGNTARAAEGHSHQPGRCQPGSRAGAGPPHLGRGPAPGPLILPSAPRQFGQSGAVPVKNLLGGSGPIETDGVGPRIAGGRRVDGGVRGSRGRWSSTQGARRAGRSRDRSRQSWRHPGIRRGV
jgi:hypothetical protein